MQEVLDQHNFYRCFHDVPLLEWDTAIEATAQSWADQEKPDDAADILEKWLHERYLSRRDDHIAQLAAWGPRTVGDAEGEFGEVAALMSLSMKALRAAQISSKEDFLPRSEQRRAVHIGFALVMRPSNGRHV